MSTTYKVGQLLVAKSDIPIEMALSGETKVVRKGSKVIIGADKLAHHFDGCIQSLSKDTILKTTAAGNGAAFARKTRRRTKQMFSDILRTNLLILAQLKEIAKILKQIRDSMKEE